MGMTTVEYVESCVTVSNYTSYGSHTFDPLQYVLACMFTPSPTRRHGQSSKMTVTTVGVSYSTVLTAEVKFDCQEDS
jgi:hypothetical protein